MKLDNPELLLAQDAATVPTELQKLSESKVKAIRRAVVQNPNTPISTLYQLGEEFPKEFLENPGLPLLLLENPRLFEQTPVRTLARLMQLEELPSFFLEKVTYEVETAVLRFKRVPLPILELFAKSKHTYTRERVAKNINASPALLTTLSRDILGQVRQAVAQNESTPVEVLDALSLDPDESVQCIVANHPHVSQEARWRIVTASGHSSRRVARLKAPAEWLTFLEDVSFDVGSFYDLEIKARGLTEEQRARLLTGGEGALLLVASDTSTPAPLLRSLASRPMREGALLPRILTNNPNTPDEAREVLASSSVRSVRRVVAASELTPSALLMALTKDEDLPVLEAVASNPNTPIECLEEMQRHSDLHARQYIAHSPNITAALIEKLSLDSSPHVQATAAKHSLCSLDTLKRLSTHDNIYPLYAVASNPNTPEEAFENLCNGPHRDSLMYNLTQNPSFPVRLIESLKDNKKFRQYATWSNNKDVQETVVTAKSWKARESLAKGYNTTAEVLDELARDKTAAVRAAVVFNPRTQKETIEALLRDKDEKVKARALAKSLSWREAISEEELSIIQRSPEERPRSMLAEYPALPEKLQALLAKDPEKSIRARIAKRQDVSPALLKELAGDKELSVRSALAENPSINDQELLQALAKQEDWVCVGLLKNPNTSLEVFQLMAKHSQPWVRSRVADSANTPIEVLEQLTKDQVDYIRENAKKTLRAKKV